jgi:phosphoribosylglycinamide formyltransferase-1
MSRKRVAVLVSGRGSNMAALIEAAKDKTYPAEITVVVSNRPDAGGLLIARANGVATEIVDHTAYGCRPSSKSIASTSFVLPGSCDC